MSIEGLSTRDRLLGLLLRHKAGLTVDELGEMLAISRNAVRQHLSSLERRGVGRPSQIYVLTPLGEEQFPRQYSLLSGWVLSALKELHGPEGTVLLLKQIATRLHEQFVHRVRGGTVEERADAVTGVLNELGYVAQKEKLEQGTAITAINCVYHDLASEFPEVCQLDIELIQQLTGSRVEHTECMVRGGHCCRFLLTEADPDTTK
jgi:DeoR family suf operon transcriptional repressor